MKGSIVLLIICCHSLMTCAQWTEILTGNSFYYTDATFADSLNAVIVGAEKIIVTSDGGNNWSEFPYPSWAILRVNYAGDSTYYAVAFNDTSNGDHLVIKSTDMGQSWFETTGSPPPGELVRSIDFVSPDTGILALEYYLYKTTDGGESWLQIDQLFNYLTWCKMFSHDSIKLLQTTSFNGYIYESTNGGGIWQNLNFNDDLELLFETNDQPIDFSDWNHGHFVFGNYYYSTDGGVSWNSIPYYYDQGEETDFQKIECPSDSVCYVMALNIPYAPIILKLLNHGETIIKTDFPDIGNGGVTSLHCLNDTFCYVTTSNGRLFVTKNGGGVVAITETAQNDFSFSFYPNPATDQLHLSFNFIQGNKTFATITNLMGVQLLSEPLNASDPVIDISILPLGIYFIGLKTDEGSVVSKFMKQ